MDPKKPTGGTEAATSTDPGQESSKVSAGRGDLLDGEPYVPPESLLDTDEALVAAAVRSATALEGIESILASFLARSLSRDARAS
jgi:hypothetical protein